MNKLACVYSFEGCQTFTSAIDRINSVTCRVFQYCQTLSNIKNNPEKKSIFSLTISAVNNCMIFLAIPLSDTTHDVVYCKKLGVKMEKFIETLQW